MTPRTTLALMALLLVLSQSACGTSNSGADGPKSHDIRGISAHRLAVGMEELEASVEAQAAGFLEREGSAVRDSLHRFLGSKLTTRLEANSAVCRPGSETASIANPEKYPFACIVSAEADGEGLQVGITLGFVGTELDGRCWRAANDRVSVTTTAPALLGRREAMLPVNQIAACA